MTGTWMDWVLHGVFRAGSKVFLAYHLRVKTQTPFPKLIPSEGVSFQSQKGSMICASKCRGQSMIRSKDDPSSQKVSRSLGYFLLMVANFNGCSPDSRMAGKCVEYWRD